MEMLIDRKGIKHIVLFDKEDYCLIDLYRWHIDQDGYVVGYKKNLSTVRKIWVKMHRLVMHKDIDLFSVVDHINHNRLDNRRSNLRTCTVFQNSFNNIPFGKSKYRGITVDGKKFKARITVNSKRIDLGSFDSEIKASEAYFDAVKKYYGEIILK